MRLKQTAVRVILCATIALGVLVLVFYLRLLASRPALDGRRVVANLASTVTIARDVNGVPTVNARDRFDAAFALGFLHGQERFFQMDLSRRIAAGELSELFGTPTLELDTRFRIHQFRRRAVAIVNNLSAEDRRLLGAYTDGVNAGLRALHATPIEYAVTGRLAQPWRMEDSVLVVFYMYVLLQDPDASQDYNLYALYRTFPQAAADFLTPLGVADWDAPLIGMSRPDPRMPDRSELELHQRALGRALVTGDEQSRFRGSNGFAVDGSHAAQGAAILSNDMHLAFAMPNVFYRAELRTHDPAAANQLVGITLPGFPCLVAGSNTSIAWGFTNSGVDSVDLVALDQEGMPDDTYRAVAGTGHISTTTEVIRVKDENRQVPVRLTEWGPIVRRAHDGTAFAELWVAHSPRAVNLGLCKLEHARSVEEALDLAPNIGIPAQNMIVADSTGRIGWTIAGALPRRPDGTRRLPLTSSDAAAGWDGWLDSSGYPRAESPEFGRIWTANARVVGSGAGEPDLGFFLLGARARQIRDDLLTVEHASERDLLRIQFDDRAVFLERWRKLALEALARSGHGDEPRYREMRELIVNWGGRAAADSVGYRLVREFRDHVSQLVFEPFVAAVRARYPDFDLAAASDQLEGSLWHLVTERPPHLLAPWFSGWDDLFTQSLQATLQSVSGGGPLAKATWGERNRLEMRHPMSPFIPLLGRLVDMPQAPLNGDLNMPLSQLSGHGPVMRLVVAPGHEDRGILEMPGGQASNPTVPYFGASHEAWLRNEPTPLLPGKPRYELVLIPQSSSQ